jgi:ribosome-associated translation inhibitor RaiA
MAVIGAEEPITEEVAMTYVSPVVRPTVRTHGKVGPGTTAYAVDKTEAALLHAPAAVLSVRLTLDASAPGNRVDVHVDVNGTPLHVHAVGSTLYEAADLVQDRLRSALRRLRRRPDQGPAAPRPVVVPSDGRPGPGVDGDVTS